MVESKFDFIEFKAERLIQGTKLNKKQKKTFKALLWKLKEWIKEIDEVMN